jgi:hypothetical protein
MDKFFSERIEEVSTSMVGKNEEYVAYGHIQLKLIKQIQDILPEEYKKLVIQLSDASNHQSAIAEYLMYTQGFKDSMNFGK